MAVIGVVAIAPITSREPVPELPKSSAAPGLFQFPTPVPLTRQRPGPPAVRSAPKPRRAPAVEWTSPDSSRPEMRVSPSASAPRIRARWEMDLSPGTWAVPLRGPARRAVRRGGDWRYASGASKDLYRRGNPWQTRPSNNPFFTGSIILVKADLGTKRACPSCAARFYDLTKRPIECPKCGFSYEPEALFKQRRSRVARARRRRRGRRRRDRGRGRRGRGRGRRVRSRGRRRSRSRGRSAAEVAATGEDEDEEAEEEEAEAESGMSVVDADEEVAIEDIEVEDDEDEEDNDLLGEVEDEEDDVSGIIDPGIAKDEA